MEDFLLRLYGKGIGMRGEYIVSWDYLFNIILFTIQLPDSEFRVHNLNQVTLSLPQEVYIDFEIEKVYFHLFFSQYRDYSMEPNIYDIFKIHNEDLIQKKYPLFEGRELEDIGLFMGELVFFFQVIDSPFFHASIQCSQFLFLDDELRVVKQAPLTINREEFDVLAEKEWNRLRVKSHRIKKKLTKRR